MPKSLFWHKIMTIVQKVQDSEFCNTCCNGTVILVLQLIAEIEERQAREGYLSTLY